MLFKEVSKLRKTVSNQRASNGTYMRLKPVLTACLISLIQVSCVGQDWPSLWRNYVAGFMDNQVRVIDRDAGNRTNSEGQACGMFFPCCE